MKDREGTKSPSDLLDCRGTLTRNRSLAELTWLRVGGPADWLFQPADRSDLIRFLTRLDTGVRVFVMGVGSNLIVRDGGIDGVVIRLGRNFAGIEICGNTVRAGAAALDSRVAIRAAKAGLDLAFLRTIPGTIGGAVRMNAGCYGRYIADICQEMTVVRRDGRTETIAGAAAGFGYRRSRLPQDAVIIDAVFQCESADAEKLHDIMVRQLAHRDATQPTKIRTAGSTFRNPAGRSSTSDPDEDHSMKAWTLIEQAGFRGYRAGAAGVSERHPNFLINHGGASATEIETLGEEIRSRVFQVSGTELEWEVMRVGRRLKISPTFDQ